MPVHFVLLRRVALQDGAPFFEPSRPLVSQRVHVADDEVGDYAGCEGVQGAAVGGDHEVRRFGGAAEQVWGVR